MCPKHDDEQGSYRRGSRHADPERNRTTRSASTARSSASYRQDLEKLFQSGGQTPKRFEGLLDTLKPEEGSEDAAWRARVQELRQTQDFVAFVREANAFLAEGHALPDDEELLIRLLDHPSERVLVRTLMHLLDLDGRVRLSRKVPLKSRISTLRAMSDDPGMRGLVDRLEATLR